MGVLRSKDGKILGWGSKVLSADGSSGGKGVAFAIYSEDDESLTFYTNATVPQEGKTYGGKSVTKVYTDFEDTGISKPQWDLDYTKYKAVCFDISFSKVKVKSTSRWFYNFTECQDFDLQYFDTSAVTDMSLMFDNCTGLTTLNVESFKTGSVLNMSYMFERCGGLNTLDISGFTTETVGQMTRMFLRCTKLKTIYSNDFSLDSLTNSDSMFTNCSSLVGGAGTAFNASKADASMAHIDTTDNPGYFTKKED